jgi:hypothetical protein
MTKNTASGLLGYTKGIQTDYSGKYSYLEILSKVVIKKQKYSSLLLKIVIDVKKLYNLGPIL